MRRKHIFILTVFWLSGVNYSFLLHCGIATCPEALAPTPFLPRFRFGDGLLDCRRQEFRPSRHDGERRELTLKSSLMVPHGSGSSSGLTAIDNVWSRSVYQCFPRRLRAPGE